MIPKIWFNFCGALDIELMQSNDEGKDIEGFWEEALRIGNTSEPRSAATSLVISVPEIRPWQQSWLTVMRQSVTQKMGFTVKCLSRH